MERVSHIRGLFLGAAIGLLLLPTYIVLANPVMAQNITTPDFSWVKDLPILVVLTIAVIVLIALLVWFFVRMFPKAEPKVLIQPATPGQPAIEQTSSEFMGSMFNTTVSFMRDSASQNKDLISMVKSGYDTLAQAMDQYRLSIIQFQDELQQGRGNQISAIIDVRDTITDRMHGMAASLSVRNEQMERVNSGIGYLQLGQTKMQKDLENLLDETKNLTGNINAILEHLQHIDQTVGDVSQSNLTIKDQIVELTRLFQTLNDRLNKISVAAGSLEPTKINGLSKPDEPANT